MVLSPSGMFCSTHSTFPPSHPKKALSATHRQSIPKSPPHPPHLPSHQKEKKKTPIISTILAPDRFAVKKERTLPHQVSTCTPSPSKATLILCPTHTHLTSTSPKREFVTMMVRRQNPAFMHCAPLPGDAWRPTVMDMGVRGHEDQE